MPRGVRAIHVHYDFKPHDTGLGFSTNVVDIGLFDPSGKGLGNADGFRGWSGGARRHFTVSRRWATPGYLAGPITPGRWHVILGPFLITPPGTPWHVTVTLEHGTPGRAGVPPAPPLPRRCPAPRPAGTAATCTPTASSPTGSGRRPSSSPRRRPTAWTSSGTSDHNTNAATRVFGHHVPDGFLVVSGEEVTTRNGHWLATGTTPGTWVDWRYRAADHQLARFTDLTRSRGGVAIAAHPFVPVAGTRWDFGTTWTRWTRSRCGTVRGTSGTRWRSRPGTAGSSPGDFTPAVGNSDSHHAGQVVGLPQTVYRLDTLSSAAVVAAVQGGHCWIAESSAVDLTFEGHGTVTTTNTGGCGDTIALAAGEELACHLDVTGVPGTVGQLIGPSGVLAGAVADGSGHLVVDATVAAGFVRAEVRRVATPPADPTADLSFAPMVAMTNPVFGQA